MVLYFVYHDTLLQNPTDIITKCNRYHYKMQQISLQNARQLSYYKMRQNFITKRVRIFITKWDSCITNCDSYYKMRCLLQNVSMQSATTFKF